MAFFFGLAPQPTAVGPSLVFLFQGVEITKIPLLFADRIAHS